MQWSLALKGRVEVNLIFTCDRKEQAKVFKYSGGNWKSEGYDRLSLAR